MKRTLLFLSLILCCFVQIDANCSQYGAAFFNEQIRELKRLGGPSNSNDRLLIIASRKTKNIVVLEVCVGTITKNHVALLNENYDPDKAEFKKHFESLALSLQTNSYIQETIDDFQLEVGQFQSCLMPFEEFDISK